MRTRLALVVLGALLGAPAASGEGLAPGSVLDRDNAAAAAGLLPAETLAHYAAGEYRNGIGSWPATPPWEPAFTAASERNAARLDVDARGTIVERERGTRATDVYGLPFHVDAADPQAGVKAIWNAYYALWRIAGTHDEVALEWIGRDARERQALLESHMLYYEGAPPARRPREDPLDLASQSRAVVTSPVDLHGTASLAWRFRDADRRDQSWTYVPALRRVRQVSPANRSDGFLGSDLSQDDGSFFDGKPEDFTWKLAGEREALVLADPASLTGSAARRARPDGTIEESWPAGQKVVGYQDGAWRGVAWAPVAPVLVRRKLWVLEAVPRDPYYLFARIELAVDKETFQGATSRKFDGQGRLLRSLQFLLQASQPIETGGEQLILPAASMVYIAAENTKTGHATVISDAPTGHSLHERRVSLDPGFFALDRLSAGK